MFLIEFLFAFFVAVVFMSLSFGLLRNTNYYTERRWPDFVGLFFLFLLVVWTAGVWATPVGPVAYDIYWAPYVFGGSLLLLFLAALIAPLEHHKPQENRQVTSDPQELAKQERHERETFEKIEPSLGFFFWILIAMLIFVIVVGYTDTAY